MNRRKFQVVLCWKQNRKNQFLTQWLELFITSSQSINRNAHEPTFFCINSNTYANWAKSPITVILCTQQNKHIWNMLRFKERKREDKLDKNTLYIYKIWRFHVVSKHFGVLFRNLKSYGKYGLTCDGWMDGYT